MKSPRGHCTAEMLERGNQQEVIPQCRRWWRNEITKGSYDSGEDGGKKASSKGSYRTVGEVGKGNVSLPHNAGNVALLDNICIVTWYGGGHRRSGCGARVQGALSTCMHKIQSMTSMTNKRMSLS